MTASQQEPLVEVEPTVAIVGEPGPTDQLTGCSDGMQIPHTTQPTRQRPTRQQVFVHLGGEHSLNQTCLLLHWKMKFGRARRRIQSLLGSPSDLPWRARRLSIHRGLPRSTASTTFQAACR